MHWGKLLLHSLGWAWSSVLQFCWLYSRCFPAPKISMGAFLRPLITKDSLGLALIIYGLYRLGQATAVHLPWVSGTTVPAACGRGFPNTFSSSRSEESLILLYKRNIRLPWYWIYDKDLKLHSNNNDIKIIIIIMKDKEQQQQQHYNYRALFASGIGNSQCSSSLFQSVTSLLQELPQEHNSYKQVFLSSKFCQLLKLFFVHP